MSKNTLLIAITFVLLTTGAYSMTPEDFLNGLKLTEEEVKAIEIKYNQKNIKEEDVLNIDVCFMIDCTGSMGSYIEMAKEKIQEIVNKVQSQYDGSKVRVAIVGYRDVNDGQNNFAIFPFSENIEEAKIFLQKLQAQGGADTPEDVNGAFQQSLYNLEWKSLTRMIYHLADAPCHGVEFHANDDMYPEGHERDMNWKTIFTSLKNLDISYLFFDIDNHSMQMFNRFKEIYDAQHGDKKNLLFMRDSLLSSSFRAQPSREYKRSYAMEEAEFDEIMARDYAEMEIEGGYGAESVAAPSSYADTFVGSTVENTKRQQKLYVSSYYESIKKDDH